MVFAHGRIVVWCSMLLACCHRQRHLITLAPSLTNLLPADINLLWSIHKSCHRGSRSLAGDVTGSGVGLFSNILLRRIRIKIDIGSRASIGSATTGRAALLSIPAYPWHCQMPAEDLLIATTRLINLIKWNLKLRYPQRHFIFAFYI